MLHLKINGEVKSTNLYLGINSVKRVGNALRELNKQCDSSEFVGWVTLGFTKND
jgi:hypothetical protein